jgi:hypothetical protein
MAHIFSQHTIYIYIHILCGFNVLQPPSGEVPVEEGPVHGRGRWQRGDDPR